MKNKFSAFAIVVMLIVFGLITCPARAQVNLTKLSPVVKPNPDLKHLICALDAVACKRKIQYYVSQDCSNDGRWCGFAWPQEMTYLQAAGYIEEGGAEIWPSSGESGCLHRTKEEAVQALTNKLRSGEHGIMPSHQPGYSPPALRGVSITGPKNCDPHRQCNDQPVGPVAWGDVFLPPGNLSNGECFPTVTVYDKRIKHDGLKGYAIRSDFYLVPPPQYADIFIEKWPVDSGVSFRTCNAGPPVIGVPVVKLWWKVY